MKRAAFFAALLVAPFLMAASTGDWLKLVPSQDRVVANPLSGDTNAAPAGAAIYQRSCASCHGDDATGRKDHPSLRTKRVHDATDGDLAWLLKNGNLLAGMPPWSRLPEAQRWQLVSYLRTLPLDDAPEAAASPRSR